MSTTIKVRCIDQVLTLENTPVIASGGVQEDYLSVEFCSKWDGLIRTAVFWRSEDDAYHVLLDENDTCIIPPEVLTEEGRLYFGLFGVSSDGKQRTSEVMRYTVVKGAITSGTKPSDPTPDIYTQLLAKQLHAAQHAADGTDPITPAMIGAATAESVEALQESVPSVINDLTTGGTSAALSAEMGKTLAQRPNPNLLHNWYFGNPVNQRGAAEYPKGSRRYTVDRWIATVGIALVVNEGSIALTNNGSGYNSFIQVLSVKPQGGSWVTASCLTADGVLYSGTVRFPSTVGTYNRAFTTAEGVQCRVYSENSEDGTHDRIVFYTPVGASLELVAVKLELGSVQTLAHQDADGNWVLNEIPDYGEELAKCQRYYQLFSSEDARPTALVDYRPAMRTTPATGTIDIDGVTYYYADANP